MYDAVFLLLTVLLFAATVGLVVLFEKLMERPK